MVYQIIVENKVFVLVRQVNLYQASWSSMDKDMTQNRSSATEKCGFFHVSFPGVLEATMPMHDPWNIEQAINILQWVKKIVQDRQGEIPAPRLQDLQEADLLPLEELGWVVPS